MKRIIAITLSLIFVILSFTACSGDAKNPSSNPVSSQPEVTLVDAELNITKFEKARLNYTSITDFTVESDDSFQTMTEEYVSLPAGTVISCDKEFAVYIFSDKFGINSVIMSAIGQKTEGYNPIPKAGELTLKEDALARFTVKGSLSDIKVKVPEDKKSTVFCGNEEIIKYQEEIQLTNNFYSSTANNVNYIYVTDIHYGSEVLNQRGSSGDGYESVETGEKKLANLKEYLYKVVAAANASPYVDFVVIGGDIVNGYETPDSFDYKESQKKYPGISVAKHLAKQHQQILEPLKECEKPVFITAGNHDDNNGHSIYYVDKVAGWLLSDVDWDKEVFREFINVDVVRDKDYSHNGKPISKYYYYDLEKAGKTTRLIFLDYNDDRFTFDSKGEVTGQPNWGEYHEGQIKWLAETALQGDFDECLMFSHASYVTSRGDTLERTIEAYQTKSMIKSPSFRVDFANRTSGDILVYHHGHEHKTGRNFDFKKRIWEINTPMMVTAIDLVSVESDKVHLRVFDQSKPIVYEMLRNGTINQTVQ
ncbi:MAG: metallophosphoesterase [Clostridia bacterium]|nr:metallophosphoesterase [Clostridia bacterium]